MQNLIQIVNGCGSYETILECISWGRQFDSTVIVVDAIWPRLTYPETDSDPGSHTLNIDPSYRFENLEDLCLSNNLYYLKMDKFAFNGEQYNFALVSLIALMGPLADRLMEPI